VERSSSEMVHLREGGRKGRSKKEKEGERSSVGGRDISGRRSLPNEDYCTNGRTGAPGGYYRGGLPGETEFINGVGKGRAMIARRRGRCVCEGDGGEADGETKKSASAEKTLMTLGNKPGVGVMWRKTNVLREENFLESRMFPRGGKVPVKMVRTRNGIASGAGPRQKKT